MEEGIYEVLQTKGIPNIYPNRKAMYASCKTHQAENGNTLMTLPWYPTHDPLWETKEDGHFYLFFKNKAAVFALYRHCSPCSLLRGGTGISKVVRPLHIKDDSCMCKEVYNRKCADDIEQCHWFLRKREEIGLD